MKILYSRHARQQMITRGISTEEVERGIKRGSKELQHPDKILSYYRFFCVVYRKVKDLHIIITVKPR